MPYQRYARYASVALLLILLGVYAFPEIVPAFLRHVATGLAILLLLAFGLNLGLMIRDVAKDQLIVLRNTTFYVGLLSTLVIIYWAFDDLLGGQSFDFPLWWLAALFLFQFTENLFRVRMDAVGLEVKLSPSPPIQMTWFDLQKVKVGVASIEAVRNSNNEQLVFHRSSFTDKQWEMLIERFSGLG